MSVWRRMENRPRQGHYIFSCDRYRVLFVLVSCATPPPVFLVAGLLVYGQ